MEIIGNKIYYKKKFPSNRRKTNTSMSKTKKVIIIVFAVIFTLILICITVINSVTPMIVSLCEAKMKSLSTRAINNAILESLAGSIKYTDLIDTEKNNNGDIIFVQANTMLINSLAQATAKNCEVNLKAIGEQSIKIPIGTLTSTPLLSGKGPSLEINVLPFGSVVCSFISEFEQAGINQTRHEIFMEISTNVSLIIPAKNTNIKLTNKVLITETIIVGTVPDTFLQLSTLGGNKLDLTS